MSKDLFLGLNHWAVVGDVLNPDKFAYKIVQKLVRKGYEVSRVHPRGGENVYVSLKQLPNKPDVLCLVTNPKLGAEYLAEAASLGITYVWLQPGADTEEIVEQCRALKLQFVQSCVLVELSRREASEASKE
ncbi:MAG: hypothetical protein DDT20_01379 [Firmicutes bacterium]|nr:hypothetical protein [Bacillota bacterium]